MGLPRPVQTSFFWEAAFGVQLKDLLVCNKYHEKINFPQLLNPFMLNDIAVNQI